MKKLLGIVVLGLFLSGNVFANHFSYKVPEVKVKEFDRWMGKLKRKDGKWYFKSPKKFKKLDFDKAEIPADVKKILDNSSITSLLYYEKDKVIFLEKYEQYGAVYGDVNPKLIYNHVRVNSDIAILIEYFTKSMNSTHERQEKYKNVFYSPDEQLDQIKDEARINSWLDSLKNKGVRVFAGLIEYPIISYTHEYISYEDGLNEISSDPIMNGYFILLFSSIKDDIDYYKFHYNIDYDYETLSKLQDKFPIKFEFPIDDIEKLNFKNEANNQILNTLANKYLELQSNKEFTSIIPDAYLLPFAFNAAPKIIGVKKYKVKSNKDEKKN